jgi:hypothetical protein
MPIIIDKNTQYGPPLVNQKYAPLLNPQFQAADQALYTALITNRAANLRAANRLGRSLTLAINNWLNAATAEAAAGRLPPLVVISSNRSGWIATGIQAAQAQAVALGIPNFANVSDLQALVATAEQQQSSPIYTPARVNAANRGIYVVVHMMEYRTYKAALNNLGINVVGFEFDRSGGGPRGLHLVGFGAARFAAMEFCKQLRRQSAAIVVPAGVARWNYAWLIDDNVIALTNFAGFAAAENALQANEVCLGFQGGTVAEAFLTNRNWARREVQAGRGGQAAALPLNNPPGIVQQMSLWNVNYLDQNQMNFGPIYITSAEDLSITNYFNSQHIPYRYYNGIGVRKEVTTDDNRSAGQNLKRARQAIAQFVTYAEAATPPVGAPPPTPIQPVNPADGGAQSLSTFIVNRVLPNAVPLAQQAGDVNVQNTAKCQGVEQILCGAINHGYIGAAGYNASFMINGANQQAVNRINL